MARPPKIRRIEQLPDVRLFKPAGVPLSEIDEVVLSFEELEAIRLKDIDGLDNIDCAAKMNVSRTTFQRILGAARNKIAQALVEGFAIKLEGGNYHLAKRKFLCASCQHQFQRPYGDGTRGRDMTCPKCNKKDVQRID